jgi:hypothetical protein
MLADVAFQVMQSRVHLLDRRRHETSGGGGGAAMSNEVRNVAKFTGTLLLATHAFHQLLMDLPDEAQGDGQPLQKGESKLECRDVVRDLPHIGVTGLVGWGRLKHEKLLEPSGCALDAARKHGFTAEELINEQLGVG